MGLTFCNRGRLISATSHVWAILLTLLNKLWWLWDFEPVNGQVQFSLCSPSPCCAHRSLFPLSLSVLSRHLVSFSTPSFQLTTLLPFLFTNVPSIFFVLRILLSHFIPHTFSLSLHNLLHLSYPPYSPLSSVSFATLPLLQLLPSFSVVKFFPSFSFLPLHSRQTPYFSFLTLHPSTQAALSI